MSRTPRPPPTRSRGCASSSPRRARAGEQVWVMAHIPPGIDVYTTYHRYLFAPGEACNVKQPQMFLNERCAW